MRQSESKKPTLRSQRNITLNVKSAATTKTVKPRERREALVTRKNKRRSSLTVTNSEVQNSEQQETENEIASVNGTSIKRTPKCADTHNDILDADKIIKLNSKLILNDKTVPVIILKNIADDCELQRKYCLQNVLNDPCVEHESTNSNMKSSTIPGAINIDSDKKSRVFIRNSYHHINKNNLNEMATDDKHSVSINKKINNGIRQTRSTNFKPRRSCRKSKLENKKEISQSGYKNICQSIQSDLQKSKLPDGNDSSSLDINCLNSPTFSSKSETETQLSPKTNHKLLRNRLKNSFLVNTNAESPLEESSADEICKKKQRLEIDEPIVKSPKISFNSNENLANPISDLNLQNTSSTQLRNKRKNNRRTIRKQPINKPKSYLRIINVSTFSKLRNKLKSERSRKLGMLKTEMNLKKGKQESTSKNLQSSLEPKDRTLDSEEICSVNNGNRKTSELTVSNINLLSMNDLSDVNSSQIETNEMDNLYDNDIEPSSSPKIEQKQEDHLDFADDTCKEEPIVPFNIMITHNFFSGSRTVKMDALDSSDKPCENSIAVPLTNAHKNSDVQEVHNDCEIRSLLSVERLDSPGSKTSRHWPESVQLFDVTRVSSHDVIFQGAKLESGCIQSNTPENSDSFVDNCTVHSSVSRTIYEVPRNMDDDCTRLSVENDPLKNECSSNFENKDGTNKSGALFENESRITEIGNNDSANNFHRSFQDDFNYGNTNLIDSIIGNERNVSIVADWLAKIPDSKSPSSQVMDEEHERTSNASETRSSTIRASRFKHPLLPCTKRPPTRLKSSNRGLALENTNSNFSTSEYSFPSNDFSKHGRNDDVISIYAESITNIEPTVSCNLPKTSTGIENSNAVSIVPSSNISSNFDKDFPDVHSNHDLNYIEETGFVHSQTFEGFTGVPWIFQDYCEVFFRNDCPNNNCPKLHYLKKNFHSSLKKLSFKKVVYAYEFSKTWPVLYRRLVRSFIIIFKNFRSVAKLMECIQDILDMIIEEDKTPYIELIINALVRLEYNYHTAVLKVISIYDMNSICLSDILLEIVCRNKRYMIRNWPLIVKLIEHRKTSPIDHGLVEEMLVASIQEPNLTLASHITRDIINADIVDLKLINSKVLQSFYNCFYRLNLIAEVHILKSKLSSMGIELQEYLNDTCQENQRQLECRSNQEVHLERTTSQNSNKSFEKNLNNPTKFNVNASLDFATKNNVCDDDYSVVTCNQSPNLLSNSNYSPYCEEAVVTTEKKEYLSNEDKNDIKAAVDSKNTARLLIVLETFKNNSCGEYLVQYIVSILKRKYPIDVFKMFLNVLNCPIYLQQRTKYLKKILGELCINVIPMFDTVNMYKEAGELLTKFTTDIQILTNVKWLSTHKHKYSDVGKYLYLCKILIRGGFFQETLRVFLSPDLNLIYGSNMWAMPHVNGDITYRNNLLKEFIITALKKDIPVAKELILSIITTPNCGNGIKIWKYFNQLILNMINGGDLYVDDIRNMLEDILEGWFHYLTKPVIRGLLILLTKQCSSQNLIKLYNLCSKKGYYPIIRGNERTLTVTTEYTLEELSVMIYVFLNECIKNPYKLNDLTIEISLPDAVNKQPQILLSSNANVQQQKINIITVLTRSFNYIINVQNKDTEPFIKIEQRILQKVIKSYCDSKIEIW